jgi:hypothetical protein
MIFFFYVKVVKKLMEDPVWRFQPKADDNQTVQSLMKYTNSIVGSVWTSPGYLLIDTPWEEKTGDLEFDPNRFQVCLFLFILFAQILTAIILGIK